MPAYLPKLPEDPLDDFNPLKYERKEKVWMVYSIGPDRQDNHGVQKYDESYGQRADDTGDIVFSLTPASL